MNLKLLSSLLMLMSLPLLAQDDNPREVINYDGTWRSLDMPSGIYYLPELTEAIPIEKLAAFPQVYKFQKAKGSVPTYWAGGKPYWFRIELKNSTNMIQDLLIHLHASLYDEVEFYVVENKQVIDHQSLNWKTPQQNRRIKHRDFIFQTTLQPRQTVFYYLKIRKNFGSISFPLSIWEKNNFDYYYPTNDHFSWGFISGIFLFVFIISGLLSLVFNEKLYLYYGIYVLAALGFIYTMQGYFIRVYGDGGFGVEGDKVRHIATMVMLITNIVFIRSYLRWDLLRNQLFYWYSSFFIISFCVLIVASLIDNLVFDNYLFITFTTPITFLVSLGFSIPPFFVFCTTLYCIFIDHFKKDATYYLLANLPVFFVAFYSGLSTYEFVPGSYLAGIDSFVIAFFIEIIALSGLLAYRVKLMQNMSEKLLIEKNLIQQQRTQAVLEAEERERIRIARDLHDGVGQTLAAARMTLGNYVSQRKIESTEMQNSLDLLEDSIKEIREISHNMMPSSLTKFGLTSALKQFTNKINALGKLDIQLQIVGFKERSNEKIELMLYRIIQEIISNIIRHAEAKRVSIELVRHDNELILIIEDDGRGFDTTNKENHGIGLKNIATRVEYLNGNVNFDSSIGKGTSVVIEIPLDLN
ncbi:sensor histidine kinase [Emticicia sp.]|uniref:sensor histidine kinase n=1 Tax=Emticicia sp. TaxID=1930953 RepID=UPI003BACF964